MKLRSTFLTVLAFVSLVLGGVIYAQDDMGGVDPCFGLAADDCAVINAASENGLGDTESFTVDVTIDFSGTELAALFELMEGFAPDMDLSTFAAFNDASFSFDGTFDVVLDEAGEDAENVAGSFTTTYARDGEEATEISYDIVLADGLLYGNDGEGWKYIDPERIAEDETLASMMGMFGMEAEMEATEEAAMDEMAMAFDFNALLGILDLPGFLSYERSGDDFIFNVDFNVLQLLLEEENEDLLNELVMTASEVDPMMAFFVPLLPTLISDGYINVVQTVDTDANIVTGIAVDSSLSLALGVMDGSDAITDVTLVVDINFSNFDGVEATDAPEGAEDASQMVIDWITAMAAEAEAAMEEDE